jgi:hypothetical protein
VRRVLVGMTAVALLTAGPAQAATYIRLTTGVVHRGGTLRGVGNASGMHLYALPLRRLPLCMRHDICAGPLRSAHAPRSPFVFLGQVPGSASNAATHAFSVRLSTRLSTGRYKVFVWCRRCGDTLLVAGANDDGQTLTVTR